MTNIVQVTIAIIWEVIYMEFRMTCLHLILAHCKGKGQGHKYFDSEYSGNWDR